MVDLNQCGLHLLVRISLLAVLLPFNSIATLARKTEDKLVKDILYSKVKEQFGKLRDNRIEVDYDDGFNRKLEQRKESFSNLRIYFETTQIKKQIAESSVPNAKAKGSLLIDTILPAVSNKWSEALSVIPARNLILPNSVVCALGFPVPEWMNRGVTDVDIIIFVGAYESVDSSTICTEDGGVLAFASMCLFDQNYRPAVGFINVCLNAIKIRDDGSALASDTKYAEDIVLHEVGHTLGLSSEFITYFRNAVTNEPLTADITRVSYPSCTDGTKKRVVGVPPRNVLQYKESHGTKYYEVVTPTVRQVARNQFACQNITGARLENQPTHSEDCFGSHFDERFFLSDLMSAFYDPSAGYFSPMTLAFLEDSGHYRANYNAAQNSPFGLGAGCGFAMDKCIINDTVPDYGKGFFCDDVSNPYFDKARWQCDASHQSRGHCDLFLLEDSPKVSYFKDKNLGPMFQRADYCPVVTNPKLEYCNYDKGSTQVNEYEVFGSDSRCVDFSMNGKDSAMCLKAICNEDKRSFDYYLSKDVYSCKEDFEEFKIANVTIQCPRLTAVCPE